MCGLARRAWIYRSEDRDCNKMKKENKLDRRSFLKTSAVGAAGISLIANSTPAFGAPTI